VEASTDRFIDSRYRPAEFIFKDPSKLSKDAIIKLLKFILDRQSTAGVENAFRFKIYVTKKGDHQSVYPHIGLAVDQDQTVKPKKKRRRKGKKSQINKNNGEDISGENKNSRDGKNNRDGENNTDGENIRDGDTVQPNINNTTMADGLEESAGILHKDNRQPQKKKRHETKKKQQTAGLISEGCNVDGRVTRQSQRLRQDENGKNLGGEKKKSARSGRMA